MRKNHFEKLFAGTVVAVEKTFLHVRDLRAAESLEKCGAARVPHKRERGVHDDNNFPMTLFEQSFRHLKPAGIKVGAYEVAFRIGVEKGVDEYAGRREREVRIGGEENALDSVCKHLPFGNPDLFEFGRHDGEQIIVPQRTVDHSVHELIGIEVSAADKESERPFDKFGAVADIGSVAGARTAPQITVGDEPVDRLVECDAVDSEFIREFIFRWQTHIGRINSPVDSFFSSSAISSSFPIVISCLRELYTAF